MSGNPVALAITGASGAPYGIRLLECLLRAGSAVDLMISAPGQVVVDHETDLKLPGRPEGIRQTILDRFGADGHLLRVFGREQWTAPLASGSSPPRAMVVCPCSSSTLSAIACGASTNLIERAADVVLKERRPLLLVTRETPVSEIHLENMLKLARMGVTILPASPGFYHRPANVGELVDFVVARVLDHLGVSHNLLARWGEAG